MIAIIQSFENVSIEASSAGNLLNFKYLNTKIFETRAALRRPSHTHPGDALRASVQAFGLQVSPTLAVPTAK